MKLWLDDERDPLSPFIQSKFGSDGSEIWVKTQSSAISRLKNCDITSISLDHDLGNGCGDGLGVAKWIEEQAYYGTLPRLLWTVHSMNPVGSKNIIQAMERANKYWDS